MVKKVTKAAPALSAETGKPEVTPAAHEPAKLLMVRSPQGVPFWEVHPAHPKGEVWVAGHEGAAGPAVQVARTNAVERALREGRLELVD